ncbi:hypothetical protein [uncultured Kriegella sp.]|uniref:hypothetical protein n=1 Tax=uncultured Kriegella sp. TaxID=1798910 RepID=UPI0030DA1A0C|tara:strand:- start:71427 stop:71615 length:189 start_codon:yes stop_codon:yes gene_type:complete
MFSTGQMIFAGLFVIAFATAIFITYQKDKKLHAKNYKGAVWVAVAFFVFIAILFAIKYTLKN